VCVCLLMHMYILTMMAPQPHTNPQNQTEVAAAHALLVFAKFEYILCCSVLQCDAACITSGHAQQSRGKTSATCLHLYVLIFTHPHLHMFQVSPFHIDLPDLLLLIYTYHIFPLLVSIFTSQHLNTRAICSHAQAT